MRKYGMAVLLFVLSMIGGGLVASHAKSEEKAPEKRKATVHQEVSRSDKLAEKLQARKQAKMEKKVGARRTASPTPQTLSEQDKAGILSEAEREREHRQKLMILARQLKDPTEIETLTGLSDEDKNLVRRRYAILHPLD